MTSKEVVLRHNYLGVTKHFSPINPEILISKPPLIAEIGPIAFSPVGHLFLSHPVQLCCGAWTRGTSFLTCFRVLYFLHATVLKGTRHSNSGVPTSIIGVEFRGDSRGRCPPNN